MANDIRAWLKNIGLDQYAESFETNDIDLDVVIDLTESDIEKLGVASMGHRKKLLRAIKILNTPKTDDHVQRQARIPPEESAALEPEAERRQLTVMFCDLVGSTAMSQRFDPEDLRDVIRDFQSSTAEVIGSLQGHIAKFMGDGALAYFGYPHAHETDAENAVRAGLELVRAINELRTPDGHPLAARVGIATGLVVVGDLIGEGASQEEAVVGETPNMAARLQSLAEPGSVFIADGTRRLLGDLFELEDLGQHAVHGFDSQLHVWRVSGEAAMASRFDAVRGYSLTKFIGRQTEVSLILDRWQLAKAGEGQVVLLSGEAGIGKSRILQVVLEEIRADQPVQLHFQCSPHHSNTALYPFVQQLIHASNIGPSDSADEKHEKIRRLFARDTEASSRAVPLITELLSIPTGDRYPLLDLDPSERKRATFDVLIDYLVGLAADSPVLIIFEDMHWADPTSQEIWERIVARIASLPLLAVLTFRPEFEPPWRDHGNVTRLSLNRLSRKQAGEIVDQICNGKKLPDAVFERIVDQADCNPLFLEEITATVLSRDLLNDLGDRYELTRPLQELEIPDTLQDSLLARLDTNAALKKLAQLAATIGRTVSRDLLGEVAQLDETELDEALNQLVEAGIVYRDDTSLVQRYSFKHALVRDAAYQSLLRSTRQQYHLEIARALEQHHPTLVESEPEVVARHFGEAGLANEASALWERAGHKAFGFSAYSEAIDHFEKALAQLDLLPKSDERDRRELALQLALGSAWIPAKAYSADEVRTAYVAAVELSNHVGDLDQKFASLRGLWNNHLMRLELNAAKDLAKKLMAIAEASGNPEYGLMSERAAGTGLMALGLHKEANACFDRGISLYDPEFHHRYVRRYGEDPGIWCYIYAAWTDDWLGHRDRALNRCNLAVKIARELPTPLPLVIALADGATVHQFRRDAEATLAYVAEAIEIADRLGLVQHRTWASIHGGWAMATSGQLDSGLAEIEAGLETWRAIGGLNNRTHFLNLLADVYRLAGRANDGLSALDEAEEIAARYELHAHAVETHRMRGELYSALNREEEAEASWLKAINVARQQSTKTLELRAVNNLAALWCNQNRSREASELLSQALGCFTEGFDTTDLKEAKALLDMTA